MVKTTFVSLFGVAAAGGKLALTWEDCGDASTHGHTDEIHPTEIIIGQDTTITGSGSTDKEVDSGSFTMKLTASMGIKETYTGKICEAKIFNMPLGLGTVSWGGMDCPVAVGPSTVSLGVKMASAVPAALAKADLALTAIDQDGEQALCVNTHLKKEESFAVSDDEPTPPPTPMPSPTPAPLPTGACSAGDQSALADPDIVGQKANDCGHKAYSLLSGFNHKKFNQCFTASAGISSGCSECYAQSGEYGAKHCKSPCISKWCKPKCLACTQPAQSALAVCTGFPTGTARPCGYVAV